MTKTNTKKGILDLRRIANSQGELARAKTVLSERKVSVDTLKEEKLFAVKISRPEDEGVLRKSSINQHGSIIVSILFVTLFLTTIITGLIVLSNSNLSRARSRLLLLQAQYSAESGADAAIAALNSGNESYAGSGGEVLVLSNAQVKSTYSTTVQNGNSSKEKIILSIGKVYSPKIATSASQSRTIEVTAQRSSTEVSSSLVSRNIIDIESGVKNISAEDVFVNGYITMHKNTTNLIAENIFVADKNTGATNCSIGGTGNLIKPSIFSTPGQTKTKITTAYNNCITPPGNSSNANFDVLSNQVNIPKIQSTYIPWSQFMDNTYQNSHDGCSDWTSGSFPRNIPSTGNEKKTHYPDNANNISSSCGSSGNLSLAEGQYNIKDNVHIRANLCATTACEPTFNNPDSTIKFIFVEGSVNFDNIHTSNGSGPIALVAYGADPASKSAVCPLGGSVYLGNSDTSSAPALYFLGMNGVCLNKTKFSTSPALGGLSGKNIYIATNPGTPFDLALDTGFPVSSIPIDLAWRALRYRRL